MLIDYVLCVRVDANWWCYVYVWIPIDRVTCACGCQLIIYYVCVKMSINDLSCVCESQLIWWSGCRKRHYAMRDAGGGRAAL